MLALLDHDVLRAALHDPPSSAHEIRLIGELPRLGVIEGNEVDMAEERDNVRATALDPEVHRVAGNQPRFGDLREHLELEARINVSEEDERCAAELLGNLGTEIREHAEVRFESFRGV